MPRPGQAGEEVRRPHDALRRHQVRPDAAPAPRVVAEGQAVAAGGEQALGEPARDAGAVGHVLAVRDHQVELELGPQGLHVRLHGAQPGRAEHVSEEEDPRGIASTGVGRSSMCAWLPASAV